MDTVRHLFARELANGIVALIEQGGSGSMSGGGLFTRRPSVTMFHDGLTIGTALHKLI